MDIYCPVCGSPWDADELHEQGDWIGESLTYQQACARFRFSGCAAFGAKHEPINERLAQASAALCDILGDDMDALASAMDAFNAVAP